MKVFFLRRRRFPFAYTCFVICALIFHGSAGAQPLPAELEGKVYAARCCLCNKGARVIDYKPRMPGWCRECNLLCADCQKQLGDLNAALEKLIEENRKLLEELKKHQSDANRYNSSLVDALVKTYGKESGGWNKPSTWNLSGFNSSLGKFFSAEASLLSNFTGVGLPMKLTTDVISILQTANTFEAATNVGGTTLDILTTDGIIVSFEHELVRNAATKMLEELRRARHLKGPALERAVTQACKNFTREAKFANMVTSGIRKADFGSTLLDIFNFIQAGAELISDLHSVYQNYTARQISLQKRLEIQRQIEKNVDLIACIKETQDWINKGGSKTQITWPSKSSHSIATLAGVLLPGNPEIFFIRTHQSTEEVSLPMPVSDEPFWDVDTFRIKAAISQLKNQQTILNSMAKTYTDEVIPPLVPWMMNQWNSVETSILVALIKALKPPLGNLMSNHKKLKPLTETVIENLGNVVIGYELFYLTDNSGQRDSIAKNVTSLTGEDQWTLTSNPKIKGASGRLNMKFPPGIDWSIDVYTLENKYVTNRSSFSKHTMFYDLPPGKYALKLNAVPVGNVQIEKGKETKLKFGFINIMTRVHWELYSASKEKYYTSGNKGVKLVVPVGNYVLNFENKDYNVNIKDGVTVRFEKPITYQP